MPLLAEWPNNRQVKQSRILFCFAESDRIRIVLHITRVALASVCDLY